MCELTVILKDSERTYRQLFLIYDDIKVDPNDLIIKNCIEEAMKNFQGEPESINIKIHLEIQ